jgi:hypothetical protein
MALIEADITSTLSIENAIYIYSSICHDSIVEGEKKPMLWRLMFNAPEDWTSIVESSHSIPVNAKELYNIDIYITYREDKDASFLDRPSTLTLHFKSLPFF